jgi:selenocysteine lyase/cysteine desulfurase
MAAVREELLRTWRPYKVRPAADSPIGASFETGTLAHELLAGFVAAVGHLDELGWDAIRAHERELGQRFLDGLPDRCTLYGLDTMEGRVPTFAFRVEGVAPRGVAEQLAERDIAVWDGDYYAVEAMERLGLQPDGAVRAGFVHYNTLDEVDRLLDALDDL